MVRLYSPGFCLLLPELFIKKRVNPLLALFAAWFLGLLALAVGGMMIAERLELVRHGRLVQGEVVAVETGVKGLKSVIAGFTSADGRKRRGRDLHRTQWIAANEIGDRVMLYHDPNYRGEAIADILIERGFWSWSDPAFLLAAGMGLLFLGVYLARARRA